MEEEPRPTSIAERIAALKLNQVGQLPQSTNGNGIAKRPPPALPNKKAESTHSLVTVSAGLSTSAIGNQPAAAPPKAHGSRPAPSLPPRRPTDGPANVTSPVLPPRRPSEAPSLPSRRTSEALSPPPSQLSRRASRDSIASTVSTFSLASNKTGTSTGTTTSNGTFTIRAPAYDPAALPPLPPKKTVEKATPGANKKVVAKAPSPAAVPQRPALPQRQTIQTPSSITMRKTDAPPQRSALLQGFGTGIDKPPELPGTRPEIIPAPITSIDSHDDGPAPALPSRRYPTPSPDPPANGTAPPIPTASRPDLAQLRLSKPKPNSTPLPTVCIHCRDFSAPFIHASHFPRCSLPSFDPSQLATDLTSPFPSPTDKALAIFAWLHHNIAYNVTAFFSGTVKPSTPSGTIASGLAVCEGYAGLFCAMATAAGLEARVVGGHGKGFGYTPVQPGASLPPFEGNHAWAVVRIDDGEWKLCDPCWGAGNVGGQSYNKHWTPSMFTMANEEFGERHYPEDRRSFFRRDQGVVGWEEYMLGKDGLGEEVQVFSGYVQEEGISAASIMPRAKRISIAGQRLGGVTRFSFTKVCAHWRNEVHGKGKDYCYMLTREGRDPLPLMHNGYAWWVDIRAEELGQPGQEIKLAAVNDFKGASGRGVTNEEFVAGFGRVGMAWGFLALWTLVP